MYTPFLQKILHTTPLSLAEWVIILLVSTSVFAVEEARKLFVRVARDERIA